MLFQIIISENEIEQLKISLSTTKENIILSISIIMINFFLCKSKTNELESSDKYRELFHKRNNNNNNNDIINEDNINYNS